MCKYYCFCCFDSISFRWNQTNIELEQKSVSPVCSSTVWLWHHTHLTCTIRPLGDALGCTGLKSQGSWDISSSMCFGGVSAAVSLSPHALFPVNSSNLSQASTVLEEPFPAKAKGQQAAYCHLHVAAPALCWESAFSLVAVVGGTVHIKRKKQTTTSLPPPSKYQHFWW